MKKIWCQKLSEPKQIKERSIDGRFWSGRLLEMDAKAPERIQKTAETRYSLRS